MLSRAVRIFATFSAASPSLTASEIARRAQLPQATAYRLVNELLELGVLERDTDNRVRIGVTMWEWASRSSYPHRLRQSALPIMERLQTQVKHHTMLGILVGSEILYLERISAPGAVQNMAQAGGRLPIHVVSAGLVLLAHAPPDLQEKVMAGPLRTYTQWTISQPDVLRRTLAEVRRTGIAVGDQTMIPGVLGMAAPVRNREGIVMAALSVVIPHDDPRRRLHMTSLTAAAREIERELAGDASR